MGRDVKFKIVGSIITIAIATVAICIFAFYALPRPAQEPIFELEEWRIDINGRPMLEFVCTVNEFVEVIILNPAGEFVHRTYLLAGATEGAVTMACWGVVPMAGTYRIQVGHPRHPFEKMIEYTFTFSPPDVRIEKISFDWEYCEHAQEYLVSDIRVEFMNRGDLPARISLFPDRPLGLFWYPVAGWLVPGERVLVLNLWDPPPEPPGLLIFVGLRLTAEDTLIVRVEGSEGEILLEHRIPLSHKPDEVLLDLAN